MAWTWTDNSGRLGSRLSGPTIGPVSSGAYLWHCQRLPSKRGRCSLRLDRSSSDSSSLDVGGASSSRELAELSNRNWEQPPAAPDFELNEPSASAEAQVCVSDARQAGGDFTERISGGFSTSVRTGIRTPVNRPADAKDR
eukprot:3710527-Prymnesium_polylepis.1